MLNLLLSFSICGTLIVALVALIVTYLPHISNILGYGKFATEKGNKYVKLFEFHKSTFKYIYLIALVMATIGLHVGVDVYLRGEAVPKSIQRILDIFAGSDRIVAGKKWGITLNR